MENDLGNTQKISFRLRKSKSLGYYNGMMTLLTSLRRNTETQLDTGLYSDLRDMFNFPVRGSRSNVEPPTRNLVFDINNSAKKA